MSPCDSPPSFDLESVRAPARAQGASPLIEPAALGFPAVDIALNGGLKADGLHELYAARAEDAINALGFAFLLAQLKKKHDPRPLLWVREARFSSQSGMPYGPGLLDLGLEPAALTLLSLPDARAVLRAGLDSVRDGSVSAIIIELHRNQPLLNLTASRRLTLAAADAGTMVLIVRSGTEPAASAAHTRWQVAAAPSLPLEANAPGRPAFELTLLRHRGGREGMHIIMEWDRETTSFDQREIRAPLSNPASLPCAVPAMAGGGAGSAKRSRAA